MGILGDVYLCSYFSSFVYCEFYAGCLVLVNWWGEKNGHFKLVSCHVPGSLS